MGFSFFIPALLVLAFSGCTSSDSKNSDPAPTPAPATCLSQFGTNTEWSNETAVPINGYTGNAMEPKISADQVVLFWNDKPSSDTQMNIHYAVKDGGGVYQYVGTLPGTVDGGSLDGVPAIDTVGNFYFVSLRNYSSNSRTIFGGAVNVLGPSSLEIQSVASADTTASAATSGTVDMDIDVSWDGTEMIVSRATFAGNPYPETSRLLLYDVSSRQMATRSDTESATAAINFSNCRVYAGSFSHNKLELYFTVMPTGEITTGDNFRIGVATRATTSDPFTNPKIIEAISGSYVEGASPTQNDSSKTLFFHKFDSVAGQFKIYKVTRP